MSYDLYFCYPQQNASLSFEDVKEWARPLIWFNQDHARQLFYENKDTGVYFSLDNNDDPEAETAVPQGCLDTGFSFNLNLVRPSFFALEAMPIVERLQSELQLLAFNPQLDGEGPRRYPAAELVRDWSKSNDSAHAAALAEGIKKTPIPKDKALSVWKYNYARTQLEKLAEDALAFVPHIYFVRVRDSLSAETMCAWTEGIPTVIPNTDWVALPRKKKRFFGKDETEVVFASSKRVLASVADLLEDFGSQTVDGAKILREQNVARANKILAQILTELTKGECQRVSADELQDL